MPVSRHYKLIGCSIVLISCAAFLLFRLSNISTNQVTLVQHEQPLESSENIPKIIWYKLGPRGLNGDTRTWTDSCINSNPGYRAQFLTDETADEYVMKAFASRPDIVENYLSLTVPILKADLLRYLLLLDQGGIWSDLDVSCEGVPIDKWIPSGHKNATLVVGWESDSGWEGPFNRQFASWTIMAKPGSPHLLQVVEDILQALRLKMDEHKLPSAGNITMAMIKSVVDFTGPKRLTAGIFKSLSRTLNRTVGPADASKILQPKMLGDVLVMPGISFAASSNKYTIVEEWNLSPKLVSHHYAGSWKNDHGGELNS